MTTALRSTALLLSLLALTGGCHRRRHAAPRRTTLHWVTSPAHGLLAHLEGERWLGGALRVEGETVSQAPWPATALVSAALLDDGAWRFAGEDGTVYRAATFTGALTVEGALPTRAAPLTADGYRAAVRPFARGALFVVDANRDAWTFDGTAPRRLPLSRVVHGVFTSRSDALAVVEPGRLMVSTDGGRTFTETPVPQGVPQSVSVDGQGPAVHTLSATLRWTDGVLEAVADTASPSRFNTPDARITARFDAALRAGPDVPWSPGAAAANPDGSLAVLQGARVAWIDARTFAQRRAVEAPGEDCVLARAGDGLRAVCRHGWANAVFALADGSSTWTTLRDEERGEPVGAVQFDRDTRAWAVSAPCRQRTEADRHLVCHYNDRGEPHEVRLPFRALLLGVSRGAALLVDGESRSRSSTRAALVRGTQVDEFALPGNVLGAQTATLDGDTVRMWDLDPNGEHVLALVRGVRSPTGWTWTRTDAPSNTRRGVLLPNDRALVAGETAASLAVAVRGGPFVNVAPFVQGRAESYALGLGGQWFCVGPWCRLGTNLLANTASVDDVTVLARADAPAAIAAPDRRRSAWACHPDGTPSPAVSRGAGVVLTGASLATEVTPTQATLTWRGALTGAATVPLAAGALSVRALGALDATAPGALLEHCDAQGLCDRTFVSPTARAPLTLPRTPAGAAVLHAVDGGWIARTDATDGGASRVTLAAIDAQGVARGTKTFLLASADTHADAGTWHGRAGLWIHTGATQRTFYALDGDGSTVVDEELTPCADAGGEVDGEIVRPGLVTPVHGEDWLADPRAWQLDARLRVREGRACVASLAGSVPAGGVGAAVGYRLRATGDRGHAEVWLDGSVRREVCTRVTEP